MTTQRDAADRLDRSSQLVAVGSAITRLHREHYGRGATHTRTIQQRNYLIVFLDDLYLHLDPDLAAEVFVLAPTTADETEDS